ncbi:MAG: hypothetical protein M3P18_19360 [Actinomycetota bacterium]|nr:hypothetical protein [Actinomycetota bacterium]
MSVSIRLPAEVQTAIWRHLLADKDGPEEAVFVFARASSLEGRHVFEHIDWFRVPREGFALHSAFHFELAEEQQAAIIKRAHDLGASIIEFHSHRGIWPAEFSGSDWAGFEEFVPHVWWRLKGRPYAALVVTATGFDGLAWIESADTPIRVTELIANDRVITPTGLSPLTRDGYLIRDD